MLVNCDQPFLTGAHLRQIIDQFELADNLIVAAEFDGIQGSPALFSKCFFLELETLEGDTGARTLLHKYRDKVRKVHIPEAALDIDTEEDWLALAQMEQWKAISS
jgi:CTP:molybdopterin cytidylyltransferase MocA